jgi:cellobiose-specific phosphotransferase system component IIA
MSDDKHEQARDLAEEALEALDEGDEARADALIAEAKKLDKSAVIEVVKDLEEDAGSDPEAAKRAGG